MAAPQATGQPIGRQAITLEGAPRLLVLDAGAMMAGDTPDAAVLHKLALLAESEHARVVLRGASAQPGLMAGEAGQGWLSQVPQETPFGDLLRRVHVSAEETLLFLTTNTGPLPSGCHAFYIGTEAPPAGAVDCRVKGPRGTDGLLALYGTALVQEKAGLAFRAAAQGKQPPASAPFNAKLFEGLVKSFGPVDAHSAVPEMAPQPPELTSETIRSLVRQCVTRLMQNVLPNGAIVAAPEKGERPGQPNYWFVWQRDAGHALLSMIDWVQSAPFGLPIEPLRPLINNYVGYLTRTQQAGHLGVSRYTVEGQPILRYGSPQLDGPAISALALLHLRDPRPAYAQIRAYLEYLLTPEGQGPGYDPWEFVYGRILNVLLLKRKAFRAAARLADLMAEREDARRFQEEARRLAEEMGAFVDAQQGFLISSRDPANPWLAAISGLNVSVVSALLTVWDANDDFLNLTHPAVMGTVLALEDAFVPLYGVNHAWQAAGNAGLGWGRFPEDANDGYGSSGGNPWPLTTLWAAQYCYRLAEKLASGGPLIITDRRQAAYFNRIAGDEVAQVGKPLGGQQMLTALLPALRKRGDGYLRFVLAHQPPDGALTEQINRDTGQSQGAHNLTWALAELVNTLAMRG